MNNRTKVTKFRDTVNSAIELTCYVAFDGAHTHKSVLLIGGSFSCATGPTETGIWTKKFEGGAWERADSQELKRYVKAQDMLRMMHEAVGRDIKSWLLQ